MAKLLAIFAGHDGLTNFNFDINKGYTYCGICGDIFQSRLNEPLATNERRQWSFDHAATHSLVEHAEFTKSGRTMTPEAAIKLMPYGVVAVSDMVFDDELSRVLQRTSSTPTSDALGVAE